MKDTSSEFRRVGQKRDISLRETTGVPFELKARGGYSPYENPDPTIAKRGIEYIEREVEKDPAFLGALNRRISGVLKQGWRITSASSTPKDIEVAEFVQHCLTHMDAVLEQDIKAMFTHVSRGFSLSEINYRIITSGRFKNKLGLKNIRHKNQRWFSFKWEDNGYPELYQIDPDRKKLDLDKFVHLISGLDDENPYGNGIGSVCAFYVWMKKNGFKFWGYYLDRYASPFKVLEMPAASGDTDKDSKQMATAEEILRSVEEDTGSIVPKNLVLKFLESIRTASGDYNSFKNACNEEISKAVLSSVLSMSGGGSSGSYALGKIQDGGVTSLNFMDALSVMAAINKQLIEPLVDANYEVDEYPRFIFLNIDHAWLTAFAQAIRELVNTGARISKSWLHEATQIPIAKEGEEILQPYKGSESTIPGIDNKLKTEDHSKSGGISVFSEKTDKKIAELESNELAESAINELYVLRFKRDLIQAYIDAIEQIVNDQVTDQEQAAILISKYTETAYQEMLTIGGLRGIEVISAQLSDEIKSDASLAFAPLEEIVKDYEQRKIVTHESYLSISEEAKRKSFTLAGTLSQRYVDLAHKDIVSIIKSGESSATRSDKLLEIIGEHGMGKRAGWHAELVVRNGINEAYNEYKFRSMFETDADSFPCFIVMGIDDAETRPGHRVWHGFVRNRKDPIWKRLRPPFGHNCRCSIGIVFKAWDFQESEVTPSFDGLEFIN